MEKNFLKSKGRLALFLALCATCLCCAILAFTGIFGGAAYADEASTVAVDENVDTYEIMGDCADMEKGWIAAVARSSADHAVKIMLANDWVAVENTTYTTVLGTNTNYFDGGAIHIKTGMNVILDLNGHAINRDMIGRTANYTGRVIYVTGGSLTIEDSSEAKSGSITGGNIRRQGSSYGSSGIGAGICIYGADALVTFNSGNITNNKTDYLGGGVGGRRGLFVMNGGYISNNESTSTKLGGGVHNYGDIIMNGGVITGNNPDGMYCDTESITVVNGGSIIGNTAHGVRAYCVKEFTLKSGTIANNTGYGILVSGTGGNNGYSGEKVYTTINLEGGSITNNASGGLYLIANSILNIKGTPRIYNNSDGSSGSRNLTYNAAPTEANGLIMKVTGKLNAGTYIGLTGLPTGTPSTTFPFTSGYSAAGNTAADISRYFFSDVTGYKAVATAASGTFEVKLDEGSDSASFASDWITAVNTNGTFKLTANWVAAANETFTTSFKGESDTSKGNLDEPFYAGSLAVPYGKTVTLDLNGYTLDRALKTSAEEARVITVGGTLIINDSSGNNGGTITGGNCGGNHRGGGIHIVTGGKVTFNAGTISGNSATHGGGVLINGGTLEMKGGVISNNIAGVGGVGGNGGGVYIQAGTFTMTKGTITQNTATYVEADGSGGLGGGVCKPAGTLTLSDTAKITDNYTTTSVSTSNVYLTSGQTIAIGGALNSGFTCGVTMQTKTGTFTSGFGTANSARNPWDYFTSDNGSYEVSSSGTGNSKQATLGLLIAAPTAKAGLTYDGTSQEVIRNYVSTYIQSYTVKAIYETGTTTTLTVATQPSDSGTFIMATYAADYQITFKLKDGYSWKSTNNSNDITVTATINQRPITVTIDDQSSTYGNTPVAVSSLTGKVTEGSVISADSSKTLYTLTHSVTSTTAAGTATITGTDKSTDYAVTFTGGKYTINKRDLTVTLTDVTETYDGNEHNIKASATGAATQDASKIDEAKLLACVTYTYADGAESTRKHAGTYTPKFTLSTTDTVLKNYSLASASSVTGKKLIVSKKQLSGLTWANDNLTYNGESQCATATVTAANGLVSGDSCTVTVTGGKTDASATAYTATATALSNSNYSLPTTATHNFTIGRAELSVTWDGTKIVYSGAEQYPAITNVTTAVTKGTLPTKNDFTYAVTAGGTNAGASNTVKATLSGTFTGNFKLVVTGSTAVDTTNYAYVTKNYTIEAAKLQVTASGNSWTYDNAMHNVLADGYTALTVDNKTPTYGGADALWRYSTSTDGATWSAWNTTMPQLQNVADGNTKVKVQITADNHEVYESAALTVTIKAADIGAANITALGAVTYTGVAQPLTVSGDRKLNISVRFTSSGVTEALVLNNDYEVSYSNSNGGLGNNINAGTVTVTIRGKGNYDPTKTTTTTFTINPAKITSLTWTDAANYAYSGTAKELTAAAATTANNVAQSYLPSSGSDFTYTYEATDSGLSLISGKAVDAGNYKVTAAIKSGTTYAKNFEFDTSVSNVDSKTFTVTKAVIKAADITWDNLTQNYTGAELHPTINMSSVDYQTAVDASAKLKTSDFTYTSQTNAGTNLSITATLSSAASKNFTFDASDDTVNSITTNGFTIKALTVALSVTNLAALAYVATYDGEGHSALKSGYNDKVVLINERDRSSVKWYYSYENLAAGSEDWKEGVPTVENVADSDKTIYFKVTADNHEPLLDSLNVTISQKDVTVNANTITVTEKTYDGNANIENAAVDVSGATFSWKHSDDELGITFTSAEYSDRNAADGKTVTVKGIALTGAQADNYNLTSTSATTLADVKPLKVEIKWYYDQADESHEGLEVVYDGKAHTAVAVITNKQNAADSDRLDVSFVTEGTVARDKADYPVRVKSPIVNATGNYTLEGVDLSAVLKITGTGFLIYAEQDPEISTLTYDGTEKFPVLYYTDQQGKKVYLTKDAFESYLAVSTDGAEVVGGVAVNAGNYRATIALNQLYDWSGSISGSADSRVREFFFTIEKATIAGTDVKGEAGMSVASGNVFTVTYNGTAHALYADWSKITVNGKALDDLSEEVKGALLNADGSVKGITVSVYYDGTTATKTSANESGYTVEVRFGVNGNFNTIASIPAKLVISRQEINVSGVTFAGVGSGWSGLTTAYDGSYKKAEVQNLPNGVSANVSYFLGSEDKGTEGVQAIGVYTVKATFVYDSANYKLVDADGGNEVTELSETLTITAKGIDLSGVTLLGDTTDTDGITYDGGVHKVIADNVPAGVNSVEYAYKNASGDNLGDAGVKDVGEYVVEVTFKIDANYGSDETRTAHIKINPAPLTVTANDVSVSYGDAPVQNGAAFGGLMSGDNASMFTLAYDYKNGSNVYSPYDGVGEYTVEVRVSSASNNNYAVTCVGGKLNVKPRTVTVSWQNSLTDGNTSFEYVYSGSEYKPYARVTNAVNNDALTLVVSGGQVNAALNCTAKVTGIEGANKANYTLPVVELTQNFNVLPSPRTGVIVWDECDFYYNGQAQAPKAYYFENETDRVPKELTVTTNVSAISKGTYTATASLGSNYELTGETTKQFEIKARKVYIQIDDSTVVFSNNIDLSATTWSYVSGSDEFVSGDAYAISFSSVQITSKGKYAIEGKFTSNNSKNYEVNFVGSWVSSDDKNGKCGTLTVTQGAYDIDGITFAGTEVTYDGKPHNITVNGLPEGVTVDSIKYVKDGKIYTESEVIAVGEYTVEITYTCQDPNFTALTGTTATLVIKKAALTVKANNNTVTYGDAPAASGVTYSGFVNGEDENVTGIITGSLQYQYTYSKYGNVGSYIINVVEGCIDSANYEITYIPGTLTVNARELSVEWFTDDSKNSTENKYTFDESNPNKEYVPVAVIMGGVVNNDGVTLTVSGAKSAIGVNYTATAESDNKNYVVKASDATTVFSIIPSVKYTVIWDNSPITYDKTVHKPAAIYFDEDGNEFTVSDADVIITTGDALSAGTHTVTLKTGAVAHDGKALAFTAHDFTIVPAAVTITVNPAVSTVTYGKVSAWLSALGSADYGVTSGTLYSGDSLNITLSVNADDLSNVGAYTVTATADNGNYTVTVIDGTLTVEKAEVVMNSAVTDVFGTSTPKTHVTNYDGNTHKVEITGTLPAGISGVSYEYYLNGTLVSADGVKNAGTYTVKAIFTADGNHTVSGEYTATLTVNAKQVGAISLPVNQTATYDGLAHKLLLSGDAQAVKTVEFTYVGARVGAVQEAIEADAYTVSAVLTFDENYDASSLSGYNASTGKLTLSGSLIINPAILTVKAKDGSVEYGTAATNLKFGYVISGFVNGESENDGSSISVSGATYGFNTGKNIAGTNAGKYANEITVALAYTSKNYTVVYDATGATLTVTPKVIDAADVVWYDKDGGTQGTEFTYTYDGNSHSPVAVYKDSTVTLVVTGAQSVAGDNYTAKVTGIDGANKNNYALPVIEMSVTFSITNEPVVNYQVIWDNTSHIYDNKEYKPTAYYYVGSTKVNISAADITVEEDAAVDAGTYTASVAAVHNGNNLTNTAMTFSISKRAVYVEIADAKAHYGDTPNMAAVSWKYKYAEADKQFIAGEKYTITFTCSATNASPIGTYAINGHFVAANAKNYDVIFMGSWISSSAEENGKFGTLTIEKASYDMSKVTFVGTEVTYDGLAHAITLSGLPVGLSAANYNCAYATSDGWSTASATNAGVYDVTITFIGLDTANYEPVEPLKTTLTIKKAALTVTAKESTVVYGEAPAANGVDFSGFVTVDGVEETEAVLKGQLTYSFSYTQGNSAGNYNITPSGLTSDNYEITFRSGTLIVDRRTVTVVWYYDSTRGTQPLEYTYANGKLFAPVAVAENLLPGDSAEITVSGAQGAVGINITATASAISNPNYKLPTDGSESVKFSILPVRENYVIWDNTRFTYDGAAHKPEAYYIAADGTKVDIDPLYITVDGGSAVDAKTGYYLAEIDDTYYNGNSLTGDRTFRFYVDPLEITVVVEGQTATYGNVNILQTAWKYGQDSEKFIDASGNALAEGLQLSYLKFQTEADNASPIGEYAISLVCDNANYKVTFKEGALTVQKATVVMNAAVTGVFDNGTSASSANTYKYDGTTRAIVITGTLPAGITGVSYEYYLGADLVSADGVKDAGVYTVKAIFTVDGNYNEITAEYFALLEITAAEINVDDVTFDSEKTVVYNGEPQHVFVMGTAVGVERVEYEYYQYDAAATDSKGALLSEAPKNAGKYVIVAKFVASENYSANNVTKTMVLEITRADLTVNIYQKTANYGTLAPAFHNNASDYSVSGLLGDDDISVIGSLTFSYVGYTDHKSPAGPYGIVADRGQQFNVANYAVTVVEGTLTVLPYVITADDVVWTDNSGTSDQTFIYYQDGVTPFAPYASAAIVGETVNFFVTVSGDNAVAGSATAVGSYVATVTGVDGNMNFTVSSGIDCAFVIVDNPPAEYEVIWTNTQFVYDGYAKLPTASYYNGTAIVAVSSGDITVTSGDLTGGRAINAGTYEAEVTVNGKVSTVQFTISSRKVNVIIGEVRTTYGTAPVLTSVEYSCDAADKLQIESYLSFTCNVSVLAGVGTYANAIEGHYTGSANYDVTFTSGTLRVDKAQIDISGIELENAVVTYDGNKHAVIPSSLPQGITATVSYYTATNGWSYDKQGVSAAGTYTVMLSLAFESSDMAQNYEPIASITGTLVINRAPLVVTALSNEITYGEAPAAHADGVTVSGFVGGDDENELKGRLSYDFNYNLGGSVGTYSITPKGLSADNYDVEFRSGVLTVIKRTVVINWYKDNSQTAGAELKYAYDGATEFKPYAVAGNLVGNDSVTLTVSGGQTNAGLKYLATVTKISNNNYALPTDGTESVYFDIIPRTHVIVWENTEFVYNAQRQAPGAYYFDEDGNRIALTVSVNGYPQQAGRYTATAAAVPGITLTGDTTRTFEIKPKKITIVIESVTATYKQLSQFNQNGWHYAEDSEEITDGNYISLTCAVTSMIDPDAGKYVITGKCLSDNYDVTFVNGTYEILKSEISVPVLASKDYTGATLKADTAYSDMYSVILNNGGVHVGLYPVTFVLNAAYARNYKWAGTDEYYVTVNFEITRAENVFDVPFQMNWTVDTSDTTLGKNTPVSRFGTPEVKFYYDAAFSREAEESYILQNATPGMKFYVKVSVEGTTDYKYLEFTHEILIVGDRALTLSWEPFSATYDGLNHVPQAYVIIEGRKVYLKVTVDSDDGLAVHAGDYTANVTFAALDNTSLQGYKLHEGEPSADKQITFKIAPREVRVMIGDVLNRVYGTPTVNVDAWLSKDVQGVVISGDNLKIKFTGTFTEVNGYVPVGSYAIVGSWDNEDYTVKFLGNWLGDDDNAAQTAGVYTVIPADISVIKTSSEWFDEDKVIEKNQSVFITLDKRTPEDDGYVNILLAGDKSAIATITYSVVYEYNSSVAVTDELIKSHIVEGNTNVPEIPEVGDWVIYYRITEPNHNVKYGQWVVRIRKNTEFIVVTFKNALKVPYGDTVAGKNLMELLIDEDGNSEYLELGNGVEDMTLLKLRSIAYAYAYRDVTSDKYVDGGASVSSYAIKFVFKDEYIKQYDGIEFKYSASNDASDTNDKYDVVKRELELDWGNASFTYDGQSHIPTATLKGLVNQDPVELNDIEIGVTKTLELKNGDVINVTVQLFQGKDTSSAGTYLLRAVTDNNNYELKSGLIETVTIAKRSLEIAWGNASFTYDGKSHIPEATLKGLVDGEEVKLQNITVGQVTEVTLASGEVIKLRFTLNGGSDTVHGNYGLTVEIVDGGNYELTKGTVVTVTITDSSKVSLPNWAIYAIIGAAVLALLIILIIALKLKKRKKASGMIDEDGFTDDYTGE